MLVRSKITLPRPIRSAVAPRGAVAMGYLRRGLSRLYLVLVTLVLAATACTSGAGGGGGGSGTTITVAVVANPQMQDIQKLTKYFEKDHPSINVNYVTLPEDQLRDKVTQDVATKGGQYDVVMIGPYEVPIWAKNGWISSLAGFAGKDQSYDLNDIFPPIRTALS